MCECDPIQCEGGCQRLAGTAVRIQRDEEKQRDRPSTSALRFAAAQNAACAALVAIEQSWEAVRLIDEDRSAEPFPENLLFFLLSRSLTLSSHPKETLE